MSIRSQSFLVQGQSALHSSNPYSVKSIFPPQPPFEGDFKRAPYKKLSTLADQTTFVEWMKDQNVKSRPVTASGCLPSAASPTLEEQARSSKQSQRPFSSVSTKLNFQQKMESIRQNMREQLQESPTRKMLFARDFGKMQNRFPIQSPLNGPRTRHLQQNFLTPNANASQSRADPCVCESPINSPEEFMKVNKKPKTATSWRPKTAPMQIQSGSRNQTPSHTEELMMEELQVTDLSGAAVSPLLPLSQSHSPKRPQTAHSSSSSRHFSPDMAMENLKLRDIQPEGRSFDVLCDSSEMDRRSYAIRLEADLVPKDDYDKALKEFGWKMELPGDPLKIKRQFLHKRMPVTVTVPEPQIMPLAPGIMRENKDTFFYNTIPKKVTTFEISPDFVSQRYNAHKEDLRKRGLWNYNHRNFSFVY